MRMDGKYDSGLVNGEPGKRDRECDADGVGWGKQYRRDAQCELQCFGIQLSGGAGR